MEYLPIMRTLLVKYALALCNCYQYIRYQWHMYYYTNSLYLFQYTCSHVFAWHINPRNQYYISNTFIWHKSILLFVQVWIIQAPTTGNNNECPFFFTWSIFDSPIKNYNYNDNMTTTQYCCLYASLGNIYVF